jgi:hypothetical protein
LVNAVPDPIILPTTFNDDKNVAALFNVVVPEIFKVETNVEGLLKLTNEGGFNIEL